MKTDVMIVGISVTILGIFIALYWLFFDVTKPLQNETMMWVLLIILTIGIVITIFGFESKPDKKQIQNKKDNSMVILNERYAKGEIKEEEFEKMKKKLED